MKKNISLDLILPFYHPKGEWCERVVESVHTLRRYFDEKKIEFQLILANDGSNLNDYPQEKLDRIRDAAGNFQFLTYPRNRGKGYCLRFAVKQAKGDFQIYTDGDFPFYPQGVIDACEQLVSGADVVMGVRCREYKKALSPFRKMLSSGVRRMNRFLLNLPEEYLDTQAGLKGFNRRGRTVFLATKVFSFLFDTEFIMLAWKNRLKIRTIELKLRPGLSFSRMGFRVMVRELRQFQLILMRLRFLPHRHKKK